VVAVPRRAGRGTESGLHIAVRLTAGLPCIPFTPLNNVLNLWLFAEAFMGLTATSADQMLALTGARTGGAAGTGRAGGGFGEGPAACAV